MFPKLSNFQDTVRLFSVGSVYIFLPAKDNIAFVGLICRCNWDGEHGLGFILHKDKIVEFGTSQIGSESVFAHNYLGTKDEWLSRCKLKEKPKKFKPHPKYGKLKPYQIEANKTFEIKLIRLGKNEEFKNLVNKNEIDIHKIYGDSFNKTCLEIACRFNNNEIVKFLLEKDVKIRYAIEDCFWKETNEIALKMLLDKGADINFGNQFGETAIFNQIGILASN